MGNILSIAFIFVAIAQVLGTIVYLVNTGRLLRRLALRHRAVHESLGSPLLILHNTPRNNILFFRWIWSRQFRTLDDPDTVALATLVRSMLVWLIYGLVVLIALFVAASAAL